MHLRQEDSVLMISLLKPKVLKPANESLSKSVNRIPALDRQRQQYEKLSSRGDEIATRILGLTPAGWASLDDALRAGLTKLGAEFTADSDGFAVEQPAQFVLDALASDALDDGRPQEAAMLFAVKLALCATDKDKADALCSISYCAVCLQKFDAASALAGASLDLHSMQPRARCIIGLCALQSGDRKTAQYSLALAARMARSNRDYAELSQAAQRLLLILHFDE